MLALFNVMFTFECNPFLSDGCLLNVYLIMYNGLQLKQLKNYCIIVHIIVCSSSLSPCSRLSLIIVDII